MKKAIAILILCIVFILIYFLQLNFFSWFTIAGIKPNLFIIFVLFIGLYSGRRMGGSLGAIFGFIIDLVSSDVIGAAAIALGIIGFLRGLFRKKLVKR